MKRKMFYIFLLCSLMGLMGCGNNNSDVQNTESVEIHYEYVFRELSEPTYIESSETFAGGDGTKENPYQISNAGELALMENLINDKEDYKEYNKAYYILTDDILSNDISKVANWSTEEPQYSWKLIGIVNDFEGVLDGNGHVISGMYINTNYDYEETPYEDEYGLFGYVSGSIKNLEINNSYICISGNAVNVGGIAGSLYSSGVIDNCISSVTMECYDADCGGIVGNISGGNIIGTEYENGVEPAFAVVSNCKFTGTINQIKAGSVNNLGGIVGSGSGKVENCTNSGEINFTGENVEAVGGIIAHIGEGYVSNCVNQRYLNCEMSKDSALARVDGIVGVAYLSNVGSEDYMSRGITIQNCHNSGQVSGQYYAGGVIGQANNDKNEWCLTINGCSNSGSVVSKHQTGGIIGNLTCSGKSADGYSFIIENCENKADISEGTLGGVIGGFSSITGNVLISKCKNTGNLSTSEQNCAGIIGYWQVSLEPAFHVEIQECENTGTVDSAYNAEGIICLASSINKFDDVSSTEITIEKCRNSGEITMNGKGCIGGICGLYRMSNIPTTISECVNTGKLNVNTTSVAEKTDDSEYTFTLDRCAGGIIGRVGDGEYLSTDGDNGNIENIQKEGAIYHLSDCYNTGKITATVEDEVYTDYFGGIIGNHCAEAEYSIWVEKCGYANVENGLGGNGVKTMGKKMTEKEIEEITR